MNDFRFPRELAKSGVALIYLFGSQATGLSTPLSDVDIGVVLKNSNEAFEVEVRKKIYTHLIKLLSHPAYSLIPQAEPDIVFLQLAPIVVQYKAISQGKVLFEISPKFRADYEEKVVRDYLDFKPVLDYFEHAFLERA